MGNQFLALSLFLMLLSFFIIMNGISAFDNTKKQLVLNSVSLAFSNKVKDVGLAPSVIESPRQSIHTGDNLSGLQGLFEGHIANFKATKNRLGTTMHVNLPFGEFMRAIDKPQNGQSDFFPTMMTMLRSEKSGVPYRVDMVLNVGDDPALVQKSDPAAFSAALRDISGLASKMEKSGLPKHLMTAGLQKGSVGNLDLYFYRYQPFDPLSGSPMKLRRKSP